MASIPLITRLRKNLLELHTVAADTRQVLGMSVRIVTRRANGFITGKRQNIGDDLFRSRTDFSTGTSLRQLPHSPTTALARSASSRISPSAFSNIFKVRGAVRPAFHRVARRRFQKADAGIGIVNHGCERLVHFMRDRSR